VDLKVKQRIKKIVFDLDGTLVQPTIDVRKVKGKRGDILPQ